MGNDAEVVIALYVNALRVGEGSVHYRQQRDEQLGSFAILKEWVRQHIREKDEMYVFNEFMTEIEGRGYLFEFNHVKWGNETDPFYLLVKRTLKEMQETFNCEPHSNCSTPYALEYAYVKGQGAEYDTVRLGAYAYAIGVKVETEVAHDYIRGVVE